jgi:hypothetical protein
LADLWPRLQSTRLCPELSDFDFLRLGVQRVLSQAKSGRDFLQTHAAGGGSPITVSHFFETLKSERRGQVALPRFSGRKNGTVFGWMVIYLMVLLEARFFSLRHLRLAGLGSGGTDFEIAR